MAEYCGQHPELAACFTTLWEPTMGALKNGGQSKVTDSVCQPAEGHRT